LIAKTLPTLQKIQPHRSKNFLAKAQKNKISPDLCGKTKNSRQIMIEILIYFYYRFHQQMVKLKIYQFVRLY